MIDHDAPHQLRGRSDKVGAVLPATFGIVNQSQVRFVEERCRLQRVADAFLAHVMMCQAVQFRLHQRDQPSEGFLIATAPVAQQLGDLLLRKRGRRHTGSRQAKSNIIEGFLQHRGM